MRFVVTLLVMLLCFALGVFMVQNTHHVTLYYFHAKLDSALYVVVTAAVLIGLLVAVVIQALERLGSGGEKRRMEREIRELREEVERLRRGGEAR